MFSSKILSHKSSCKFSKLWSINLLRSEYHYSLVKKSIFSGWSIFLGFTFRTFMLGAIQIVRTLKKMFLRPSLPPCMQKYMGKKPKRIKRTLWSDPLGTLNIRKLIWEILLKLLKTNLPNRIDSQEPAIRIIAISRHVHRIKCRYMWAFTHGYRSEKL